MSSWSAALLSTCCSFVLYLCGWSVSSWPAESTSDWPTASPAVCITLAVPLQPGCFPEAEKFFLLLLGEETFSFSGFSGAVGVMLWQPSAARVPRTLYCMASFHKSNPGVLYSHVPVCVFVLRDGCYLGVVVWDRVHTLHWPKELSTVWKRECHCGPQPRFWDRLPVWLDLLWEIWSSWGKWK